jgi:hypothetical protein
MQSFQFRPILVGVVLASLLSVVAACVMKGV